MKNLPTSVQNEVLECQTSVFSSNKPVREINYVGLVFGAVVLATIVLSACGVVS